MFAIAKPPAMGGLWTNNKEMTPEESTNGRFPWVSFTAIDI